MKILGTGLNGLVGSRIVEILSHKHEFDPIGRPQGLDITDKASIEKKVISSDASVILHLAAKTNVDACEEEKDLKEESEAWKVNVLGTQYLAQMCAKTNKKIIYISTDFVFSGDDTPLDGYTEENIPNPQNWYGVTKYEAEKSVEKSGAPHLILRISYPYRVTFGKPDLVRSIISAFRQKKEVIVTDRTITPTFIDDIATGIDELLILNASGTFHLTGGEFLTFPQIAEKIANGFGFDKALITKIKSEEYYKNKAKRPFNVSLKNDRIVQLGVKMNTFTEGFEKIKNQL